MAKDQENTPLHNILLGKTTEYPDQYNPEILFAVPRQLNRDDLALEETLPLPFYGQDVWHGYELSWLNAKGKPQVALARFCFDCESINIIESKSFKLYLNSYNQSKFFSVEQVELLLEKDLTEVAEGDVKVTLFTPDQLDYFTPTALPGTCIDDCDITIDDYRFNRDYLTAFTPEENATSIIETLHSHLLKSNCLITNQPDWASVVISYSGKPISHEGLLRYLISFRQHNEFHEQCVERIFNDIWTLLQPMTLTVTAYYTRRGGLDINPCRSSEPQYPPQARINRQ